MYLNIVSSPSEFSFAYYVRDSTPVSVQDITNCRGKMQGENRARFSIYNITKRPNHVRVNKTLCRAANITIYETKDFP